MFSRNNYKKGFTLAEVLVTLSIVGVVSVLTLPNVISNYQNKVYVSQLQKVYNQISNAVVSVISAEGGNTLYDTSVSDDDGPEKFLNKYFKISQICGYSNSEDVSNCFADLYSNASKSIKTTPALKDYRNCYAVKLNTGASICMTKMYNPDRTYGLAEVFDHADWYVFIDLNGPKPPNVVGRDFYGFDLYSDGVMGTSYSPRVREFHANRYCNSGNESIAKVAYGTACIDKIIQSGWKMDY